jgi:hypothetical protein
MVISRLSNWKDFFLQSKQFNYLNDNLIQLRESIDPSANSLKNFEEISKNPGVCFLALDPSETKLQLFHHPTVICGSWKDPIKKMIAFIDLEFNANPVELVPKSIKEIKGKSHSIQEFNLGWDNIEDYKKLRNPKANFHYKIIVPVPTLLTKAFFELSSTDPIHVAVAFFDMLYSCDVESQYKSSAKTSSANKSPKTHCRDNTDQATVESANELNDNTISSDPSMDPNMLENCLHIIQFCHLCSSGKISPVLFTSGSSPEAKAWRSSILTSANIVIEYPSKSFSKHKKPEQSSDDENEASPANKLTQRDDLFIDTML